jgi:hypothetical protein
VLESEGQEQVVYGVGIVVLAALVYIFLDWTLGGPYGAGVEYFIHAVWTG